MTEQAVGTLPRGDKGAIAPPPPLDDVLAPVGDAIGRWPGVVATTHWHLYDMPEVDGIDFSVGEAELGHIHLGGEIHLATSPTLGAAMIAEGAAQPFR